MATGHDAAERFEALRLQLFDLLDKDAVAAMEAAEQLQTSDGISADNIAGLRGILFIEAGQSLKNTPMIERGLAMLRGISPSNAQIGFNIANGLAALVSQRPSQGPGQIESARDRRRIRKLFRAAGDRAEAYNIRSAALTNLANQLRQSSRWVEAYDTYAEALEHDPSNAIALSGIAALIERLLKGRTDEYGGLRRAARRYLIRARDRMSSAQGYAGPDGVRRVEELVKAFKIGPDDRPEIEVPPVSGYAKFLREHRLFLCVEPESAGSDLSRWDHLGLGSVSHPLSRGHQKPIVFMLWNLLKSEYLAARWLAFASSQDSIPETGGYADTLDYARYGVQQAALTIAHKSALDVLDKIAVASADYLGIADDVRTVHFGTFWHERDPGTKRPKDPLAWAGGIAPEVEARNTGLIALAELAYDYDSGFLQPTKETRNAAAHRFIVLHDEGGEKRHSRSQVVDRHNHTDFEDEVVACLQIARAGLFYFRDLVRGHEKRKALENPTRLPPLILPSHDWVRGRE